VPISAPRRYRLALTVALAIGLLASLAVAVYREFKERAAVRVEIALDYADFAALAKSYGYDQLQFLIALRRAGLTSLAVSEELGGNIDSGNGALLVPGQQLIDQARLSPLSDPTLAGLARANKLDGDELYLIVYDAKSLARYRANIAMHLGPHAARTIRASAPAVIAIRSQSDFFNALGLGLPSDALDLAAKAGLFLVPRVQNDERLAAPEIDAIFASFGKRPKPTTVIFFGQRNEVLGFPDHLDDTAAAFERTGLNFGSIETYDKTQVQKGNDGLGLKAIDRTVRVQAISKVELDKLDYQTVIARYLLGVRERNVRVVYLRPFLHANPGLSLEKTNVQMVADIKAGLVARGFRVGTAYGRATPLPKFAIPSPLVALASLAVPAIFLLLLEAFGVRKPRIAYLVFAADLALVATGYAVHHDLLARKLIALSGAILFPTMSVVAIPRSFTLPAHERFWDSVLAGLRTVAVATAFALAGALVVVGLLSVPALMQEIDRFSGVKLVIVVPPLLAFALYVYTRRFGNEPRALASALEPVRVYQLAALVVIAGAAALYVMRSGNQSDIAPSAFELSLRSGLTTVLGIRPRFKEFAVGFPLMMLLPALRLEARRAVGWFFALGIAVGAADVVDTFSHLHTPLVVSLLRVVNGAVIGIVLGIVAIYAYRSIDAAVARASAARRHRTARAS
jgi:hypothetical protein